MGLENDSGGKLGFRGFRMGLQAISARLGPRGLTAAGLFALCVIVGTLGFFFVQEATSRLLDAEARIDASRWSSYLSTNVRQLRNIAGGATPTRDIRASLDRMLVGGSLLTYRIYDASGDLKLQSYGPDVANVEGKHITEADPGFSAAFRLRQPATLLREGSSGHEPGFIASALLHDPSTLLPRSPASPSQGSRICPARPLPPSTRHPGTGRCVGRGVTPDARSPRDRGRPRGVPHVTWSCSPRHRRATRAP